MLRGSILAVRFMCELVALAGLAYWGFGVGDGFVAWIVGIGSPLVAASVWGACVAPKARWPVRISIRLLIELAVFSAAVIALLAADEPVLAALLAISAFGSSALNARIA